MRDSFKHQGLRRKLVQHLRLRGIVDEAVLEAIGQVPRHFFFDSAFEAHAYQDKAFPIELGQTISQPFTVAMQTQLAQVQPGHRVLEVGTGSGYQAAILHAMGAQVFSIEYLLPLQQKAMVLLENMGYRGIQFFHGDGSLGLPGHGPYHSIIVTAGAPALPAPLAQQLLPGGHLVVPQGPASSQTMMRYTHTAEGLQAQAYGAFSFVPLVGQHGWG